MDFEIVMLYCSMCMQMIVSINIIDDWNRVIYRRVVKNFWVLYVVIEKFFRNKVCEREYVRFIENLMEIKQYFIKKYLIDLVKFQNNGIQYLNYENVNVVWKFGCWLGLVFFVCVVKII